MGVMECRRKNCKNIMCNDYLIDIGYICYECKRELEESLPESEQDVRDFMDSRKNETDYYDEDNCFVLKKMFMGED